MRRILWTTIECGYFVTMIWQIFLASERDPIADWIRKGKANVCN